MTPADRATGFSVRRSDGLQLRRGSAVDLPSLEPLWVAVHHQHAESMPGLGPYVDDATTWAERSALYRQLLRKPDTVLLLAELAGSPVGYGLAHVVSVKDTWIADTWVTSPRIGEIESLGVLPACRGRGIGSLLLGMLEQELSTAGVVDTILGVLPGNAAAIRLYERRGFQSTWLYMSRFAGRSR